MRMPLACFVQGRPCISYDLSFAALLLTTVFSAAHATDITCDGKQKLYFNASTSWIPFWNTSGAVFSAYFYNGSTGTFAGKAEQIDGDIYAVIVPAGDYAKEKALLEQFVEQAKQEKNAGNGLQLIPVCKYLSEPHPAGLEAMETRVKPFSILFVDHERLVVGMDTTNCTFFENEEYGIKLSFSIKRGPILTRDIFVTSLVNKIYRSADGLYSCVDFRYTTLQEEDLRFLYEKATSTLFN